MRFAKITWWALNAMTNVLTRERQREIVHRREVKVTPETREGSEAAPSQAMAAAIRSWKRQNWLRPRAPGGSTALLNFGLLDSRTASKYFSVVY